MTAHFRVSGRVQGVFFRVAARQQADRLKVKGWVRNQPDGRVEGMAHGARGALEEFRRWLQRGPEHARVSNVEWE
ncbi:MAG: acylphosphatase, partial [Gammaproteobacteria bacterium]